ncbi:MAG TPA: glycosyltransferase family 4 protein [Ignavibacteria bacterium]|nr:glycosyltransferase family 4 protein [Ignavibacteria bacterium]
MSGSRKILLIVSEFPPGPGGIGNHAFNLAKYLNLNGCDVTVLTISDFAEEKEQKNFDSSQKFEIFRFKRYDSRLKTTAGRLKSIRQYLNKEKYSHVIFSGRYPLMTSVFLNKYHKHLKFISIVHGGDVNSDNAIEKYLIKKALQKSDLIIPVSNFSGSFIDKGISKEKIKVIPNGFDLDNIDQLKVSEKSLVNGSLNLITVGTVWPRKGHHNVLNAFPEIINLFPETKYNIAGRLADLSKIEKLIESDRFKDHLNLLGPVSNKEKIELLNGSQIFILLSESQSSGDFEGFGIAVLEANYFGLPAIGSFKSGLEDSIKNGYSGVLVDPKNKGEILEALKTIAADYRKFSEGAKEWAAQHHWSNIIKRYLKEIEGLK